MKSSEDYANDFFAKKKIYEILGDKAQSIITELIEIEKLKVHYITNRSKDVDSFKKKIEKKKYQNPLTEVTDLCGIRIIVYVNDDVDKVCEIIRKSFVIDEDNSVDKNAELGEDRVGYRSVHLICSLPKNRTDLPENKKLEGLIFEVQVRTILQHSWAEIEHDKNYKFSGGLPPEIKRRFMVLSGGLEILDREFNQISKDIDKYELEIQSKTKEGELGMPIDSLSLRQYLVLKYPKLILDKIIDPGVVITSDVLEEMRIFGLDTLQDFGEILPKDLQTAYEKEYNIPTSFTGLIRNVMLIKDIDKYMSLCYHNQWQYHSELDPVLSHYNVDLNKLKPQNIKK